MALALFFNRSAAILLDLWCRVCDVLKKQYQKNPQNFLWRFFLLYKNVNGVIMGSLVLVSRLEDKYINILTKYVFEHVTSSSKSCDVEVAWRANFDELQIQISNCYCLLL